MTGKYCERGDLRGVTGEGREGRGEASTAREVRKEGGREATDTCVTVIVEQRIITVREMSGVGGG